MRHSTAQLGATYRKANLRPGIRVQVLLDQQQIALVQCLSSLIHSTVHLQTQDWVDCRMCCAEAAEPTMNKETAFITAAYILRNCCQQSIWPRSCLAGNTCKQMRCYRVTEAQQSCAVQSLQICTPCPTLQSFLNPTFTPRSSSSKGTGSKVRLVRQ